MPWRTTLHGTLFSGAFALTAPQHINTPLAVAATVERNATAVRRPGELLRGRIREHALHRAVGKVEKPGTVAEDLEDDLRAVRRDRGRSHERPLDGRLVASGFTGLHVHHHQRVFVGVGDEAVVGKPRGRPRLARLI